MIFVRLSGRDIDKKKLTMNPTRIAMLKLRSVPINMYSLVFRVALNLKTDFAAIRKPIAVYCWRSMNVRIKKRSR